MYVLQLFDIHFTGFVWGPQIMPWLGRGFPSSSSIIKEHPRLNEQRVARLPECIACLLGSLRRLMRHTMVAFTNVFALAKDVMGLA